MRGGSLMLTRCPASPCLTVIADSHGVMGRMLRPEDEKCMVTILVPECCTTGRWTQEGLGDAWRIGI